MSAHSKLSFVPLVLLSLCCSLAQSRHIHHHHHAHQLNRKHFHHAHHARQIASPIFTTLQTAVTPAQPALPSITAGDALTEDIDQIQSGMNSFSADLVAFFNAIKEWFEALRSLVSNDLSPEVDLAPELEPKLPTSITSRGSVPVLTAAPDATAIPQSTLCRPAAGAGPLVPCPESSTTSFRTITSTSTRSNTITTYQTVSYANSSALVNGTAILLLPTTAPSPTPNLSSTPPALVTPSVQSITLTTATINAEGRTSTSTLLSYALSPTPTPYTFNAASSDNVAVYYGTTPSTTIGGLLALCADSNVDIVLLAFVHDFFSAGGYPSLDFGPGCIEPNSAQRATAPGLKDCSALAPQIAGCQQQGKKVVVSLGGWNANSSFASAEQATQFATTLWNLFGPGDDATYNDDSLAALRPFGPSRAITVDGFDLDPESRTPAYYDVFASALRARFATARGGKTYYLSAAPQCPIPDASIPLPALAQADFVWVQFYNNPACNLDSPGFQASFAAWAEALAALNPATRLYVGVPASPGAGTGYVEGKALYSRVVQARELEVGNLGGLMLWDGAEAEGNVDGYGVGYLEYAKDALQL